MEMHLTRSKAPAYVTTYAWRLMHPTYLLHQRDQRDQRICHWTSLAALFQAHSKLHRHLWPLVSGFPNSQSIQLTPLYITNEGVSVGWHMRTWKMRTPGGLDISQGPSREICEPAKKWSIRFASLGYKVGDFPPAIFRTCLLQKQSRVRNVYFILAISPLLQRVHTCNSTYWWRLFTRSDRNI